MKKLLLSAFVAFAVLASTKTFAQQGFGTNSPDKSAAVDIVSSKRGLLIPRLDLSNITVASPVDAPAHGLLVYNKATSALTGSDVANNVTPGFYYWERNNTTDETQWQGKWVRIVSSNTEKKVIVEEGNNIKVVEDITGLTTTYTVSVEGGTKNGQVLVSVPNPDPATATTEPFVSEWVDPDDFIKGVNGINVTTDPATGLTNVGLGGSLDKDTTITTAGNDLAIIGLPIITTVTNETVMVMDASGILKQVAVSDLLKAKDLTLENELEFTNSTTGVGAVLQETKIGIKDRSVGADKLDPGTATAGQIATVVNNGGTTEVQYQDASTAIGKTLTTDNIIGVGADAASATASTLNGAVLTPTYLKIKEDAITAAQIGTGAVGTDELAADAVTNAKLADNAVQTENISDGAVTNADLANGAVTADKMQSKDTATGGNADSGSVPVANGSGGVTYQTIAAAAGENLTTDGKIVVGPTGATSNSLTDAVLVATHLSIAPESITSADILNGTIESTDIKDGTITTTDIQAPNSTTNLGGTANQVMVTDGSGNVTWATQESVVKKDNYNFTAPLAKDAGVANAAGGKDYTVTIATASATTLGVVKQATAGTEEVTIATDGTLSINEANITLAGDVTGPLNDTNVAAIQGTTVSATAPTSNQVLTYNSTTSQWTPTAPTSLVNVDNGISKATSDGDVILGGTLNEPATTIITGGAANTLAVQGLIVPTAETAKIMYAEGTTGIMRTAARSISQAITSNQAVDGIIGYNNFVQEVNVNVTLSTTVGAADINVTLPAVSALNKGQVINVKITNATEPTNYVNIIVGSTTLTYGALPYQGWIVKSNGSTWEIVGRN